MSFFWGLLCLIIVKIDARCRGRKCLECVSDVDCIPDGILYNHVFLDTYFYYKSMGCLEFDNIFKEILNFETENGERTFVQRESVCVAESCDYILNNIPIDLQNNFDFLEEWYSFKHSDCYTDDFLDLVNRLADENLVQGTKYAIHIKNENSQDYIVGLFQYDPTQTGGYPLVWGAYGIAGNGGQTIANWEIDWGLNWGTTSEPLANGVYFTASGPNIPRDPSSVASNGASVSFNSAVQIWNMQAQSLNVPVGTLGVQSDSSFSTADAQRHNLVFTVTVDEKAIFAMDGQPNSNYIFQTHPRYYLSTVFSQEGEAVTGTVVSNSDEVEFPTGVFTMYCTLNIHLQFSCQPNSYP